MAAVATAPSVEAMEAIVAHINSGTGYALDVIAEYSEQEINPLEEFDTLRVDVTSEDEEQLNETLDTEGRTSHNLRVWIRSKVNNADNGTINPLKLLAQQLFQRLNTRSDGLKNGWESADRRVKIWELNQDSKQNPDKDILNQIGMFVSSIALRVEVEAS